MAGDDLCRRRKSLHLRPTMPDEDLSLPIWGRISGEKMWGTPYPENPDGETPTWPLQIAASHLRLASDGEERRQRRRPGEDFDHKQSSLRVAPSKGEKPNN